MTQLLLDHNANIKAQNKKGHHAASYAKRKGNLEVLKLLVEKEDVEVDGVS